MDGKYHPKVKISKGPTAKEKRDADKGLDQETKDAQAVNLELHDSGSTIRLRPGTSSRKILQEDAEEGQPVMRSEPKKSLSKEIQEPEILLWPGYLSAEEGEDHQRSNSPVLKVTKWDNADLHRGENVTYIILAMKDFVLYAVYLTTLLILVYGSHDNAYNYYATVTSDVLTKAPFQCNFSNLITTETFETIKTSRHIWCYLNEVLMNFLYPKNATATWVLLESVLVGAPAMVQIRVKNETCQTTYLFEGVYKTCYDYYRDGAEDRDTFGDGSDAFTWRPFELRVGAGSLTGGGFKVQGGFEFNFTQDYNFTKYWLNELEQNVWIRQGTRYVVVDFTLYAPNTNLFLVCKLVFEQLPAGGIYTNSFFYTWKILRYFNKWDFFVMSCEVLNAMFVFYFTFEEAVQIWVLGGEYLTNWWNLLDLTIISLSYTALVLAALRHAWTLRVLADKIHTIHTNIHANFNEFIQIQENFITMGSILLFFAWIKLFKFTTLFRSATLLLMSVERVVPELIFLFYQAAIISIGFALLGQIMFGEHIIQFSTSTSSFFSMIGIYVGRMHFYRECLTAHSIIGPLYFGSYIILVCMLHVNAFVAVIVQGYREANNLLNEEPERQYFGDLVFNTVIQLLMRCGSDRLLRKLLMRDIIHRRQVDYDEFVLILKKHGIHGLQLRLLLAHHELKRGNEMHIDRFLEIYNDLLVRHQLRIESQGHDNALQLIEKTDQLLQSCTTAILDVQSKIEILIDKMISGSLPDLSAQKKKKQPVKWF